VQQNLDVIKGIADKGITIKVDKFEAVFEAIDIAADSTIGTNDYVFLYLLYMNNCMFK
jgi:hypothetical protein